jgi:hypothetical protein
VDFDPFRVRSSARGVRQDRGFSIVSDGAVPRYLLAGARVAVCARPGLAPGLGEAGEPQSVRHK